MVLVLARRGQMDCECRVILGYIVSPYFEKKKMNETKPPNQIRTRKNSSESISFRLAGVWKSHPGPTLLPATSQLIFMVPCYSEGLRVGLVGPGVTILEIIGS